jgi:hypothetical protein
VRRASNSPVVPPRPSTPVAVPVCADPTAAAALTSSGVDVVLILPERAFPMARPPGPGRVAVLVGDAGRDLDLAAAQAMGAELFGA